MITLPHMLEFYHKYGNCCYLSLRKGLIKKHTEKGLKQWAILGLTGLTFNNRFAPFAVAFLEED